MKNIISSLIVMAIITIILGVVYLGYSINRWWNWKYGYESRTKALIEKTMSEHTEKYHKGENK